MQQAKEESPDGGRHIPEGEDERGHPRKEVAVDSIKRSPDVYPGNEEPKNVY